MNTDRIDLISAYCDRWCERCAYTSRCSAFAVEAAAAMCGDFGEGLELAVGAPPGAPESTEATRPDWVADLANVEMTAEESATFGRSEAERDARIETAILKSAWAVAMLSHRWFAARYESVAAGADPVLKEALAIASHDAAFETAKLNRALDGRDRYDRHDDGDDHPVQNDWNGSAKIALISIERSATWL